MTAISPGKLWGLRRLADAAGRFKMLAVDQRPPIKQLTAARRGEAEARYDDVCAVKALLVDELAPHASAALLDPHYAYPAGVNLLSPGRGLILTLEDSLFEETPGGRRSAEIEDWSVEKIKRAGGDAVKVLAWYRPDCDPEVADHQREFVARIGAACARYDLPYVFELLLYPLPGESGQTTDYVEQPGKRAEHVVASVEEFAAPRYGVDLFKLESPLPAAGLPDPDGEGGDEAAGWFAALDRAAGRPWVMLSAGATKEAFRRVLAYAYRAGASGYLAGRAIWWEAFQAFPDLDAVRAGLRTDGVPYMEEINALTDAEARPWTEHPALRGGPVLAGAGHRFRESYPGFGEAP